jgi:hypothetical protein
MPDAGNDPHHFDFDLDRGIRTQVVEKLEASPLLSLEKGVGPTASGIYALYFKGDLVYIGKASKATTKSKRTLGRCDILPAPNLGDVLTEPTAQCRYLIFSSEWWVFAAEFALMAHYRPEWNESGFGSKVPGVGRPGTHRVSRWNELFPKKSG